MELCASFCRALAELDAELNVLKFVTWILPQLTARKFFKPIRSWLGNQSEAGLAKFEIWIRKYRPRKLGQ